GRAGLALENLLEDLARGVGIIEARLPDIGRTGERAELRRGVTERGLQLRVLLEQLDEIVVTIRGPEQTLELRIRLLVRAIDLERGVPGRDRVVERTALMLRDARHLGVDRNLIPRRLREREATG